MYIERDLYSAIDSCGTDINNVFKYYVAYLFHTHRKCE